VNNSLTITLEGRFQSETVGCLGVHDRNGGRAEVVKGHLVLTPDEVNLRRIGFCLQSLGTGVLEAMLKETELLLLADEGLDLHRLGEDLRGFADEFASFYRSGCKPIDFIPVHWGERLYLIPKDEGPSYCNCVNLGLVSRFPAHGFYLRASDKEQEVNGLPRVPREWQPMLLETPINGKIIDVLADERARVNLGSESGVWTGMHLETDNDGDRGSEVVEVDAKSCVIKRFDRCRSAFKDGQGVSSRRRVIDRVEPPSSVK
jgi:hypothetical protein